MKKVISLLLALMIVMSLATTAFASTITVTGNDKYTFAPGSEYHMTDLFGSKFKNLMPGDVLTEEITIKGDFTLFGEDYVKVWLEAIAHDAQTNPTLVDTVASNKDFLSQLKLKITNTSNNKVIYDGTADGVFAKTELGTFRKNSSVVLKVELSVPIELDNKYANRIGEIDWVLTVSAHNDSTSNPKTGDYVIMGAVALMVVSAAALVVLFVIKRKRSK